MKPGEWLLVIVTWMLWLATAETVSGADKTAERQLRAYSDMRSARVESFEIGEKPTVLLKFRNIGQTPAIHVIFQMEIGVHDLDDPPSNIEAADPAGSAASIRRGVMQIVNSNFHLEYDVDGRSLPYVGKERSAFRQYEAFDPRTSDAQIGPQLTFSGFVRPLTSLRRSRPHPSNNYQQPFSRLQLQERDLRSVLLTLGCGAPRPLLARRGDGVFAAFALLGLFVADWWNLLLMWVLPVGY